MATSAHTILDRLRQNKRHPTVSGQGNASVSVPGGKDRKLVITGHAGLVSGGVPLRVYPYDSSTRYDASFGEVVYESNHVDKIFEVVQFSGTKIAELSKEPLAIESYELMGRIISANGEEGADDGNRKDINSTAVFIVTRSSGDSNIKITYDPVQQALVATADCFATFKVYYTASYALVRYSPQPTDELVSAFWGRVTLGYTYGTVVAQLETAAATFEVSPPSLTDDRKAELWRVESTTIANEAGQWEYPSTGWPDGTPSYTGGGTTPDPGLGYQENARVHQIGYIDAAGFISIRDTTVQQSQGPSGVFTPVYAGKKFVNSLASDPTFSGVVSTISSADEAFINTRLGQYGLDYASLPE